MSRNLTPCVNWLAAASERCPRGLGPADLATTKHDYLQIDDLVAHHERGEPGSNEVAVIGKPVRERCDILAAASHGRSLVAARDR